MPFLCLPCAVLDRDGKIGDLEDKSESLLQGATQFNKSCKSVYTFIYTSSYPAPLFFFETVADELSRVLLDDVCSV